MALDSRLNRWRPFIVRGAPLAMSRRVPGGFVAVLIAAIFLPVLAIAAYLLGVESASPRSAGSALVIGAGVGLISIGGALVALRQLLAPVGSATAALRVARGAPAAPSPAPDGADQIAALLIETQRTLNDLTVTISRLEHEAATDPLTNQLNRRAGEQRLQAGLARATDGSQLAVVLIDVDGLKTVNDRWGHAAGDAALAHLAAVLSQHVSDRGWVARWGGDEFLVVFTEETGSATAEHLLAEVAAEIAAKPIAVTNDGRARLGISWGLAWPAPGETGPTIISRADAALYRAKQQVRPLVDAGWLPLP